MLDPHGEVASKTLSGAGSDGPGRSVPVRARDAFPLAVGLATSALALEGAIGLTFVAWVLATAGSSPIQAFAGVIVLVFLGPPSIVSLVAAIGILFRQRWAWWAAVLLTIALGAFGSLATLYSIREGDGDLAFVGPVAVVNLLALLLFLSPSTKAWIR